MKVACTASFHAKLMESRFYRENPMKAALKTKEPILTNVAAAIASQQEHKRQLRAASGIKSVRKVRDSKRLTKAQAEAVRELVLSELRACYSAVQSKRREMPAWARGYDSALSAIEERIANLGPL